MNWKEIVSARIGEHWGIIEVATIRNIEVNRVQVVAGGEPFMVHEPKEGFNLIGVIILFNMCLKFGLGLIVS